MNAELVNRELTVDPDAVLGSGVQTKWSLAGLRSCLLRHPGQSGEESGGGRVCEALLCARRCGRLLQPRPLS